MRGSSAAIAIGIVIEFATGFIKQQVLFGSCRFLAKSKILFFDPVPQTGEDFTLQCDFVFTDSEVVNRVKGCLFQYVEDEGITSSITMQMVTAHATRQAVITIITMQHVIARLAGKSIVTIATMQHIITIAAVNHIITACPQHQILTTTGEKEIISFRARDDIRRIAAAFDVPVRQFIQRHVFTAFFINQFHAVKRQRMFGIVQEIAFQIDGVAFNAAINHHPFRITAKADIGERIQCQGGYAEGIVNISVPITMREIIVIRAKAAKEIIGAFAAVQAVLSVGALILVAIVIDRVSTVRRRESLRKEGGASA